MIRKTAGLAAAMALCSASTVQAATRPACISSAEMHGLIAYFLPAVINEVATNCSAFAPASSYLRAGLPGLQVQLHNSKEEAWPMARSAFFKLAAPKDSQNMAKLSDAALRPLVEEALSEKFAIRVDAAACGEVNDIAEALAPLDPSQTVHLIATVMSAAARKDNKLRSCPRGI